MSKAFAKVVCDSKFGNTRLITLEIDLWRAILPEFNTHRTFSRNFQSTRAVPTRQLIEQVRNNPYIPVKFAKNQPGMVAGAELESEGYQSALSCWKAAAESAAGMSQALVDLGVHKEVSGRLLEPFMWTKGVVTATYSAWIDFLKLRAHPEAQPEIQALAYKIKEAIEASVPEALSEGEWHLPYATDSGLSIEDAVKVSASCCAQVSYRRLDDSVDKAIKIYDMLNLPCNGEYPENPPHFSPTEHIAIAAELEDTELSGNFWTKDFVQYRKVLEVGLECVIFDSKENV